MAAKSGTNSIPASFPIENIHLRWGSLDLAAFSVADLSAEEANRAQNAHPMHFLFLIVEVTSQDFSKHSSKLIENDLLLTGSDGTA